MTPTLDPSLVSFAERLADAARPETLGRFRRAAAMSHKGGTRFDPVTDADREAERRQRELIRATFPEHGIVGEEHGAEREDAELRWVLDPIDGTRAFVCGVPSWTTLVALEKSRVPVVGVIDQPFTDERWVGFAGKCTYRRSGDERPCTTSGAVALERARVTTTDPRDTEYFTTDEARAFARVAGRARLARFSLDAYGYALLAQGEIDVVVEASLKRHDFSALKPVIEGAGGVITSWSGGELGSDSRGTVVAAASAELHAAVLSVLRE